MSLQVGARVGDYEIVGVLGAGAMGRVYKVRNTLSDRVEAMKVLLPNLEGNAELADRFLREIKVQAGLSHPNIATLHTAQRVDNQLLMLMEFVEGQTVETLLEAGPLPVADAVGYTSQVLAALAYAHSRGVVHRDIKPSNLMRTASGTVKLMDFGIARMSADRKLTKTGHTLGSLYYMSPEQIQGAELDGRADIYSLGVTLYEMVTGRRPFRGDSDFSVMTAHLQQKPVPPIELDPLLPKGLNDLILMAIEKDPAARFQTAEAFRGALATVTASAPQPISTRTTLAPPPSLPRVPAVEVPDAKPVAGSRRGLYMAVGAVVVVIVLAVAGLTVPLLRRTEATGEAGTASGRGVETVRPDLSGLAPQRTPAPVAPPAADPTPAPTARNGPNPFQMPGPTRTAVPPTRTGTGQAERPTLPVPGATPTTTQPNPPVAPPSATVETPKPAPGPGPQVAAALQEAREQYNQLAIRAGTLNGGLQRLQAQQAASGYGMRADLVEAQQRMNFLLTEAQTALRAGQPDEAKRYVEAAERAAERIGKVLGQ